MSIFVGRRARSVRCPPSPDRRSDEPLREGEGRMSRTAATVLRSVLDHGPVARSTIARLTGLSAATVTKQYAELAERGLVREVVTRIPRVTIGRPHVPVDIDVDRHVVCGVHIAYGHTTGTVICGGGCSRRSRRRTIGPRPAMRSPGSQSGCLRSWPGTSGCRSGSGRHGWAGGRRDDRRAQPARWKDVRAEEFLTNALDTAVRVESHSRALARAEQLFGHDPEPAPAWCTCSSATWSTPPS